MLAYRIGWMALGIAACCLPAWAAVAPLGSVAGTGVLLLNGMDISTAGVLSWPIVSGDELATDAAGAVIMFHDSNRVFLEPLTHIRIQQRNGRTVIDLIAGKLYFSVKRDFVLDFQVSGRPVALAAAIQGALSIEKNEPRLQPGVPPPPLVLDRGVLKHRFPYGMGLPGMN